MEEIEVDVFVAGGGMAGFAAAVSAAKHCKKVILAEKEISLGGMGTNGMLGEINGISINGKNIISKTGYELIEDMIKSGYAKKTYGIPMTSNTNILVDRLRYNCEYMKFAMESILLKYGVEIMYGAFVSKCIEKEYGIEVTVKNSAEKIIINSKTAVDATGNAYLCRLAGHAAKINQLPQSPTLIFKLSNVKINEFEKVSPDDFAQIADYGKKSGVLPAGILSMFKVPMTDTVVVNCTRAKNYGFGIVDFSYSVIETRRQIFDIIPFIRKSVKGCENADICSIASILGERDRIKIVARHELKGKEIINAYKFEDSAAYGVYPVDVHKGGNVYFVPIKNDGIYTIPFSSMIPEKSKRIIACGKCIDSDNIAFGSIRVMSCALNMGAAAGAACSAHKSDFDDNCIKAAKYFTKE